MDLDDLVKSLLGELNKVSKAEAVVGQVRDAGKAKVLPLSKISIGFGAASAGAGGKAKGAGKGSDAGMEGGGVGGAVVVEPKAFVVVGEDGIPHMLALRKGKGAVARRGLEILPQVTGEAQLPAAPPKMLESKGDKPKKPGT
jgi:uncharacterized spore protein YtfJ